MRVMQHRNGRNLSLTSAVHPIGVPSVGCMLHLSSTHQKSCSAAITTSCFTEIYLPKRLAFKVQDYDDGI